MEPIKFSVVVTVLNEAKHIQLLLDSLQRQTLKPAEIIIVDAGSTDETKSIVRSFKLQFPISNVRLIEELGCNRSQGRNRGIEKATYEHIAVTDAGCVADKLWLETLASGFIPGTEAVAGFYTPVTTAPIQHLFAAYVVTSEADFEESSYLPSSRSLAFTKAGWIKAGKYPEQLSTCEDLVFAAELKKNCMMTIRRRAIVYWDQVNDFQSFFHQIAGYARGDVEARYIPHVIKITSIWFRYALFSLLPPLFLIYLVYPLVKHRRLYGVTNLFLLLPVVQIVADFGVMWGSLIGVFCRPKKS